MRKLSLALAALALASWGVAGAAAVKGYGAYPCSHFLSDLRRSSDPDKVELNYFEWAEGYISRLNDEQEAAGRAPLPTLQPSGFGLDAQRAHIRDFCAANPSRLYAEAAISLWNELVARNRPTS
ncbi:MAG TPA: hypothetical protein VNH64_09870 [Parvularculaceae bacterium]|nr:hypothetical protein [Parvularculaceae bacterium]